MQTRKKALAKNAPGEHANSKTCRQPRKVTQAAAAEKKVNDLITSSAKKQKYVGVLTKKNRVPKEGRNLTSACDLAHHVNEVASHEVTYVANGASIDRKHSDDNVAESLPCSIFSPAFHHPKEGGDDSFCIAEEHKGVSVSSDDSIENQKIHGDGRKEATIRSASNQNADSSSNSCKTFDGLSNHSYTVRIDSTCGNTLLEEDEFSALGNLSSEVSAIYLAMQHSKLECVDEQSQESISTEGCVEPDENEEFDEFDPYVFIKDLPDLSVVVPKFRPVLLPKQTRSCPSTTLVLDLDETLVHSTLEPCEDANFTFPVNFNFKEHTIYVRCRPYLKDFLERVAGQFETIIFTASQSIYAEQLLNIIDPKRKLFRHRVYRESCVYVEGNYLKDLSVLGRDLARVVIVDNSPQAFGFQLDNGVPIESWFDDRNDKALLTLLPFLESLVGVEDVRPLIATKFNLREKVATAASLSMDFGM